MGSTGKQRVDRERHSPADQAVQEAVDGPHVARHLEGRDEDRGHGGLADQRRAAAEQQHDPGHEDHDQRDLKRARADRADQQIGDRDPDRHAEHELHGPTSVLTHRRPERDDRPDRGEERSRVTEQLAGDEPCKRGGGARLDQRPGADAQALAP